MMAASQLALTESAGNGKVTSVGCFSKLRGHQSGVQGHSDTHHMALIFSDWYLSRHKVVVTPSIHGMIRFIEVGVR